nr:hypothetical protein [Candidatus Sigynarchaeota archaeon]
MHGNNQSEPERSCIDDGNEIASILKQELPSLQAICEPWFGSDSLILCSAPLHFKVRVINDTSRGLVNLFEMVRVDKDRLFNMMQNPSISMQAEIVNRFANKSAFVKTLDDAKAGISAFHACLRTMCIDISRALASGQEFVAVVKKLHGKLEPVMVENLAIADFIPRFDKPYTLFFIPASCIDALLKENAVLAYFSRLKGRILVQFQDNDGNASSKRFIDQMKEGLLPLSEIHLEAMHGMGSKRMAIFKARP